MRRECVGTVHLPRAGSSATTREISRSEAVVSGRPSHQDGQMVGRAPRITTSLKKRSGLEVVAPGYERPSTEITGT